MLTALWTQSQNINMTPAQKQRVVDIFTAEKIIDISKAIDNEKRLTDSIKVLEKRIETLKSNNKSYRYQNKLLTDEILSLNTFIRENFNLVSSISDEDSPKFKIPFFTRFHARTDIYMGNFDFEQLEKRNLYRSII